MHSINRCSSATAGIRSFNLETSMGGKHLAYAATQAIVSAGIENDLPTRVDQRVLRWFGEYLVPISVLMAKVSGVRVL